MMRKVFFWASYVFGRPPWDTGITPPEITRLIDIEKLPSGRALDLGCGTGTNSIYLAKHDWHVVGIDYVPRPIQIARRKAQQAGVADRIRFVVGDAAHLTQMNLGGGFDLGMDIGCAHSLPGEKLPAYARSLAQMIRPGGVFMLYMFRPTPQRDMGLEPEAVERLFASSFTLTWSSLGQDNAASHSSAWYRFARNR